MIIRISGNQGSGKTTMARRLAEKLGWQFSYTGGIFREMAREAGLAIEEFYAKMKADPELEKSIDRKQEALMMAEDNLVVDGRLAAFQNTVFPAFNIFLKVGRLEGARRQKLRSENRHRELEEVAASTDERMANERARYKDLYGIEDHMDESRFDYVLDTTELDEDAVFQSCLRAVMAKINPL